MREPVRDEAARSPRPTQPDHDVVLRIRGLRKEFDGIVAVEDVDLDVRRGELFALLGGSGCGKSTLLRMLAGLERPTAGRVELDGEDITGVPAYRRPVNMMFQSYALFPHMTVAENVAFGLRQDPERYADQHPEDAPAVEENAGNVVSRHGFERHRPRPDDGCIRKYRRHR